MNIHYLQHEPFEDLACIEKWAKIPGNTITSTKFYQSYKLPDINGFDMLIIMGGPMGVYDEEKFPWLKEEKEFIKRAIGSNKKVIGICLGSQLIAEALGSKVYKNKEKEIGWFDVEISAGAKTDKYFKDFPSKQKVFHWHGDTFDLPPGAVHIASSAACRNQAFTYKDNVVALQFHIEATSKSIKELVDHCKDELIPAPYIQNEKDILANEFLIAESNKLMYGILDKMK
jgi:GMP synthase-like glutamine amidotransferase